MLAPIAISIAKIVFPIDAIKTTFLRLYLSARNPPKAQSSKNGKRLQNAMITGHFELPDSSTAIHVAVTVKIHIPPNENIPVSQIYLKSGYLTNDTKWSRIGRITN